MASIQKFDLKLLEKLNKEYAKETKRLPYVRRDRAFILEKALKRIAVMQDQLKVSFKGLTVLELGCGKALISANLPKVAKVKKAIGIDIFEYDAWKEHTSRKIKLIKGDLAQEQLVKAGSVDVIVSGAVMEHVTRPIEMINAIYKTLRPGGVAWMYFNLQRGPRASHRYNEIFFPWSHLLFQDSVCAEFYDKHHNQKYIEANYDAESGDIGGEAGTGFSWVNRMTVAEYLLVFQQAGFEILDIRRRVMPIDVPFYLQFEDILGRYSALDLETDFATFIIRKPDDRKKPKPLSTLKPKKGQLLDYTASQKELNKLVARAQAKTSSTKTTPKKGIRKLLAKRPKRRSSRSTS